LSDKYFAAVGHERHFNVSHEEGLLAIAVNMSGRIGVDIKKIRKIDQLDTIASTLLSKEQQCALNKQAADERFGLFLRCWVHREAVTIALGVGLLRHVEIEYPIQDALSVPTLAAPLDELSSSYCVSKLLGSRVELSI
jgi:phosphopantetheinyl transferase